LTERWRAQATRPRQRRTLVAMKPRMAPTIMKTVPSGMVLCCMKGACWVLGTTGVTIVATPVNVGRSVGSDGSLLLLGPADGSFGRAAVVAADVPVLVSALVFPFICVAVERLGRSEAAASCADAPIASSETARAAERTDDFRKSLMMTLLSNCCTKRSRRSWTSEGERRRAVRRGRPPRVVCLQTTTTIEG
jgi:hypothetical protein